MPELTPPVVPPGRLRSLPQPVLTVGELTLRPWQPSDVPAVVEAYRDPAIQRWHVRSMSDVEALAWVTSWPQQWRAETATSWAITTQAPVRQPEPVRRLIEVRETVRSETVVGRIAFKAISLAAGNAEVSYWTLPAARGHDIAARALRTASEWMFTVAGLHRLELDHSMHNPASCRVAEKAGFVPEGIRRRHGLHQDGWHDMHLHARLADDTDPKTATH